MGFLYRISSPSGKAYIGITAQGLSDRWRMHRAEANRSKEGHLQNAIRKYGAVSMECVPLVYASDYEYLKTLERRAIRAFGTKSPNGYNMTDGGDGVLGVVVTQESRERRRAAQQRSFADTERRARHLASQRTPALRQARSKLQKTKMADLAYKERVRKSLIAAYARPDVKAKLAARASKPKINDGLTKSQRYRLKDLDAYRKRKREYAKTPEQRKKRTAYMQIWLARRNDAAVTQ